MKQNRLTGLLFAVFLLAGCGKTVLPAEDGKETQVPAPSDDDDDEQKVYSVEAFRSGSFGDRYVWVKGYIVGACSRKSGSRLFRLNQLSSWQTVRTNLILKGSFPFSW